MILQYNLIGYEGVKDLMRMLTMNKVRSTRNTLKKSFHDVPLDLDTENVGS